MNSIDKRYKRNYPAKRELTIAEEVIIDLILLRWFVKTYLLPRKPAIFCVHKGRLESRIRHQRRLLEDHKRRCLVFKL